MCIWLLDSVVGGEAIVWTWFFFQILIEKLHFLVTFSHLESKKVYRIFIPLEFSLINVLIIYLLVLSRKPVTFLIAEILNSVFSDDCWIKNLHFEDVLVEVSSASQSQLPFTVYFKEQQTLSTCCCVISEPDLLLLRGEELLQKVNKLSECFQESILFSHWIVLCCQ